MRQVLRAATAPSQASGMYRIRPRQFQTCIAIFVMFVPVYGIDICRELWNMQVRQHLVTVAKFSSNERSAKKAQEENLNNAQRAVTVSFLLRSR